MPTRHPRPRTLAYAFALLAITHQPAAAAGPTPEAAAMLAAVIAAYQKLAAYADHGTFTMDLALTPGDAPAGDRRQQFPLPLRFARPNRIAIETGVVRLVSDGKTLSTAVAPLRLYTTAPAPSTITFDSLFSEGPAGSLLFGSPAGPMMQVVLGLLTGRDPTRAVRDLGDSLVVDKDRDFEGGPSRVLKVGGDKGPSYLLLIDPATMLLRGIEASFDPSALNDLPFRAQVRLDGYRWTAGAVSTAGPDAAVFAFEPPAGYQKVAALTAIEHVAAPAAAGNAPPAAPRSALDGLVGKAAPGFSLTVLDGEGKVRAVGRDDLAGKVVLLDFWATWCGPCLAEFPDLQTLIESAAKANQNLVVVAVSQDDNPKDPAALRALIEKTLRAKDVRLAIPPVGLVALDPANAVGDAFHVEGYPTTVLIDAKGVVRAAHVGFRPQLLAEIAREIDALLKGEAVPR